MRRFERLAVLLLIALSAMVSGVDAREEHNHVAVGPVTVAELPPEVRDTLALIRQGGPFPYRKDGTVFQNRERRLPVQKRGYYSEFTVRAPGARDRGPRRIIAGKGATGDVATSGEYYYTDDHYGTFRRIRE